VSQRIKRITFLVMPGSHVLELAGPYDAFSAANTIRQGLPTRYEIGVASIAAGALPTFGGLRLLPDFTYRALKASGPGKSIDTLLVVAGASAASELPPPELIRWLRRTAPSVRRIASVCTGAFVLAAAGLLDARKATTHWAFGEELARRFPSVQVDSNQIFTRDGNVYTSAGVTAGIDLALSLIEEDRGREVAMKVARSLVVYLRRPGTQHQFSEHLKLQSAHREPLRELQAWMLEHLNDNLTVETLAGRVGMSPRNFARVFQREVELTPARYVERIRLEAARRRLEEAPVSIDQVAAESGFGTRESLRRAFQRHLNVPPGAYRDRFRSTLIH
jgi:transcriptional regulator GlxA family with amidase domain